jgi:hypothetical protein
MPALHTYLDDLLAVLRTAAGLDPIPNAAGRLRDELADRLDRSDPDLADRVRRLDDWHAEVLADFVADAQAVAATLALPPRRGDGSEETKVG